jgi:hypothetical protein
VARPVVAIDDRVAAPLEVLGGDALPERAAVSS